MMKFIKSVFYAILNLTRAQLRTMFSLAMVGGIIALSMQNIGLIYLVYQKLGHDAPGSLFGQMALNQQWWNNAIMAGFAAILGLVVWGADYLRAKYPGGEIEAGDKNG